MQAFLLRVAPERKVALQIRREIWLYRRVIRILFYSPKYWCFSLW